VRAFRVTITVLVVAESFDEAASRAAEAVRDPDAWLRVAIEGVNDEG
jgi:hypothetical protein